MWNHPPWQLHSSACLPCLRLFLWSLSKVLPVICSSPASEPHDCWGLVHWCCCVCTPQRKREQEHTNSLQSQRWSSAESASSGLYELSASLVHCLTAILFTHLFPKMLRIPALHHSDRFVCSVSPACVPSRPNQSCMFPYRKPPKNCFFFPRMERSHSCWPRTVWCVVNMFHKNRMRSLIIANGTKCYSILYCNSPWLYIRLKYTYSVISVKLNWLPRNSKKWTID